MKSETIDNKLRDAVWQKGKTEPGFDASHYRKDSCGAWMAYEKYGDTSNPYGWEIDHVYPRSRGGDDSMENLRPMNWNNNRSKGDDYPSYQSSVVAYGNKNMSSTEIFTVNDGLQSVLAKLYDIELP